jgi:hypothetical protein
MTVGLYARAPDASASTVGDRVVLYHRVSRAALVLNPTGSWIWEQLADPRSSAVLADHLRTRFPSLSPEGAERDVNTFLTDLVRHGMVTVGS